MKGIHRRDAAAVANIDELKPGEYVYRPGEGWYARAPNGDLANLSMHDCTLVDDALTVEPSILVGDFVDPATGKRDPAIEAKAIAEGRAWHGYLEHGVWRAC